MLINFATQDLVETSNLTFRPGIKGYSAPEQLRGEATALSDIYSAGAFVFASVTGRQPSDYIDLVDGHLTTLPSEIVPSVSENLSKVIAQAMSPQRFESARSMYAAIRNAMPKNPATVMLESRSYQVTDSIEIGRRHECNRICAQRGSHCLPEILVSEGAQYVSPHHAKIFRSEQNVWYVKDLITRNHTALSSDGGKTFRVIPPGGVDMMHSDDVIAIVYSGSSCCEIAHKHEGALKTLLFKET